MQSEVFALLIEYYIRNRGDDKFRTMTEKTISGFEKSTSVCPEPVPGVL
jgi:hypothetical protein